LLLTVLLSFTAGHFPETQGTADEAVLAHRSTQADAGAGLDPHATWTFPEIIHAAEAPLQVMGEHMKRVSEAGVGMTAALWPGAVTPDSFTRLARWLEAGPARLHAWRVSAARAGADLALRFIMSWYPELALDRLAAQRAGAEPQLQAEADRIAVRASYLASFASHDEFQVERTEDGGVVPPDDFGLLLDDPEGSSEETGVYLDDEAELDDTGASANPEATVKDSAVAQPGAGTGASVNLGATAEESAAARPGAGTA
jgi:hypothetical protein